MFDRIKMGYWWDRALTLVEGCTPVSPGCDNCWSAAMEQRFRGHNADGELMVNGGKFTGRITIRPDRLGLPQKVKKPTAWAVWNDLFHDRVPLEFAFNAIEGYFQRCNHHVFMILTKRPERVLELYQTGWDIPKNVWLGITAENQEWFDKRWVYLKQIPASQIFISYEPALGPLVLPADYLERGNKALTICGGESGPYARPMHPEWARSLRDQCQTAGVPFFFKQHGEWIHTSQLIDSQIDTDTLNGVCGPKEYWRVGKKAAGRLLDGEEYLEIPHYHD